MKSANNQTPGVRNRWAVALFLCAFLILLAAAAAPLAGASQPGSPPAQTDITPTLGNSDVGNTSSQPPQPQGTPNTQLQPVPSGAVPQSVPTGAATGSGAESGTGTSTTNSAVDFPWLILIGIGLLILAALGFFFLRPRRNVVLTSGPAEATPARRSPDVRTAVGPPPTHPSGPSATATTTATTAGQATLPIATPAAAPMPTTLKCPNCGSENLTSEKFCHECGEDLRPLIDKMTTDAAAAGAAAAAPTGPPAPAAPPQAAPVDIVEEDTPYLETLDRVDEQLEFVLSRPRVVIGTAQGNDIIIDSSFNNWQTVSPRHAELRREQDGFVIVDRESENGTFVNDMRTGENLLSDGDLVRLGEVRFVFHVPSPIT